MKILLGFLIVFAINIAVNIYLYHRRHDAWPKIKWMVLNLMGGFSIFFKALFAFRPIPRRFIDSSDGKYAKFEYDEVHAALEHTHALMRSDGWTRDRYQWRKLDCEDYAMKMKVEIVRFLADNSDIKDGIPVGIFGYKRKDGLNHVVVIAHADGKDWFFDIFPEDKYLTPMKMTPEEIDSCMLLLY